VWIRMFLNDALLTKRAPRFRDVEDSKHPLRFLGIRGLGRRMDGGAPKVLGCQGRTTRFTPGSLLAQNFLWPEGMSHSPRC
jgi:hypothetical protein